jgi:hypothetical protein
MDFAAGVYLSAEPHPPPYTKYTCIQYILIHTGKGGRGKVESERRLGGQNFTKLGRKYQQDLLYLQSINSDTHLSQCPFTGHFL